MIGTTISHYKILGKLGEGGMGEVYLAEDTDLERNVAVKFLPPHVELVPEVLARFQREAKATAALQHPNIVTIHEIGSHEGRHYIVMAYIEGDLLGDIIAREDMSIERALAITLELCDALGEAHRVGVIHRDLKPNNIIIDPKGHPHVLDFGLAVHGGATRITEEGTTVGTPHYMSPEQSQGEAVDERTDIFSLGAILYEMIAGHQAFPGDHPAAILYKVASEDPQPLSRYCNRATPDVERIVSKALAKDRQVRYQTMSGFAADMRPLVMTSSAGAVHVPTPRKSGRRRRVVVGSTVVFLVVLVAALGYRYLAPQFRTDERHVAMSSQRTSIAVLPFKNSSNDPEDEYFTDGMTDALITELGKVSALNVIARYSMMKYKGTTKPLREIAGELSADVFVEGSVLHSGSHVRINVELIHAGTGERLWGDSYESEIGEVFVMQADVARAITGQIKVSLAPFEEERFRNARSADPEAVQAYLRGRYYQGLLTPEGIDRARESYERALSIDPEYAPAYVGLAEISYYDESPGAWEKVSRYARKALELDPTLEEAHSILAGVKIFSEWDWEGARELLDHARSINSNEPRVRTTYSSFLMINGRLDEGVDEQRSALAVNPLSHVLACSLVRKYYTARQYDRAVGFGTEAAVKFPTCPFENLYVGEALIQQGDFPDAISHIEASMKIDPTDRALARLGCVYALTGRTEEALGALDRLYRLPDYDPYYAALVFAALGERDKAFEALEEAFRRRSSNLPWLATEPALDSIREDPRFKELVQRIGLKAS